MINENSEGTYHEDFINEMERYGNRIWSDVSELNSSCSILIAKLW